MEKIIIHEMLTNHPVTNHSVAAPGYGNNTGSPLQGYVYDPTGQVAPPGAKPRVTATLWEDEGSLCYQVEAKGVCVARREGMFIKQIRFSIPREKYAF